MNKKKHSKLWLYFTLTVFITIFIVFIFIALLWLCLVELNLVEMVPRERHAPILLFAFGSLILGSVLAFYVGKLIIHPIQNMQDAFKELSKGNFEVRLPENEKIMEIKEMAQCFNAMTHDLAHIEILRNDFVNNVSHEFKTPLSAISGYATLLQNPNLSKEKHDHYVEKILENAKRLTTLSGNILMLSKLENQEMIMDKSEFRLDEQIRQCILMLEEKWQGKQIEFDLNLQRQFFYGSAPLLEQVWLNLLDNAIKHSPMNSTIELSLFQQNDELVISIKDYGCGMSEEDQKHIFEKFYQGDASRKEEGNGLGLALVKRILDLCKGKIQVKSKLNEGSEFLVTLPLD